MCSILGILDIKSDPAALRELALELSRRQRHRGPDWSGVFSSERAILAHERLAIMDVEHGTQPLVSPDGRYVLAVNGEIYNHRQLEEGLDALPDVVYHLESFDVTTVRASTPAALAWDASFSAAADPSGRAVRGVHRESL